jgi:hypothetical protein
VHSTSRAAGISEEKRWRLVKERRIRNIPLLSPWQNRQSLNRSIQFVSS